uniref:Uncharacterized protein n=1 Tax=Xiphophorus couchianus TaxID=32473 RepID=A0A3B5M2M5_9TELE
MDGCRAAAAGALRLAALSTRTQGPLRLGAGTRTGTSVWAQRSLSEPAAAEPRRRLKSAAELPGPSWFTTLYWLFIRGYGARGHLLQCLQKRRYGPIWRSRFGPFQLVNVASPRLIAQVIQQEGRYPVRVELPHWKEYRDLRGQAYGLHVDSGPEWHRIRSVLNPKMLRPREVSAFAPVVQTVVDDLLARLELLRRRSPDGATVPDLAAELYKFGFEGISAVLFETRLGCLQEEIPADTLRFIAAVNDMLTLSDQVVLLPRWSRGLLPFWGRFVQAWDDLYGVAQKLVDRRMAELAAQPGGGGGEGMFLTYLLSSDRLSRGEVYISVTELMLGGVDTTSNTLSWALYHLARDRPAQNRLQAEVDAVCPDRQPPGAFPTTQFCERIYVFRPSAFLPCGQGRRSDGLLRKNPVMQHYDVHPEVDSPLVEPKTRTLLIPSRPINLRFLPRA